VRESNRRATGLRGLARGNLFTDVSFGFPIENGYIYTIIPLLMEISDDGYFFFYRYINGWLLVKGGNNLVADH